MGKRMTTDEFVQKAKQVHGNKYDYSKTVYVKSREKVVIVCPVHGPFEQLPPSHLSGNGCPGCAREWTEEHRRNLQESSRASRGMTTEEWVERAKAVHGDKYDYSQTVYVNQRTDVTIICPKHGSFRQKADSHLRGHGCVQCGLESEARDMPHTWSDAQRRKIAATCREKYGADRYLDSEEGKRKIAAIKSEPEFRKKMHTIISSPAVQEKTKATSLRKYGVESPAQLKSVQDKIYRTKKKNHTVNSSKAEQQMWQLLVDKFGVDDVIHQYKSDDRYPFVCDFYVKSVDLFIELNAHWSHGGHWFGDDVADAAVLTDWYEKARTSHYYQSAVHVWQERDILKRDTAKKNGLNYVVFWKSDLSDFKDWIQSKPLVLCNT